MRPFILTAAMFYCAACPLLAQKTLKPKKAYRLVANLDNADPSLRNKAREALIKSGDLTIAPALVEAIFFYDRGRRDAAAVLDHFFNTEHGPNYKAWIALIGSREDIVPKEGYLKFKAELYGKIDPDLSAFFKPTWKRTIRPVEILSGGITKDGIPALFNPKFIEASEATWMRGEERVFGVAINGDIRAYPLRIMDWHEMANDVVGGVPVSLSYCTLCGSGILFDTRFEKGTHYTFGSSGLLYRSNKLMYDHQTQTLWSNLTGEPVMGKLVGKNMTLKVLPMVVTTWRGWLTKHPTTKVLSTNTGYERNYLPGAAYGKYFASPDTMFPVWNKPTHEPDLADKDWMWVSVFKGQRKAWPLKHLLEKPFLIDKIGEERVVLITDPAHESVRVYSLGARQIQSVDGIVKTQAGQELKETEDALVSKDGKISLPRIAGHRIYWFGWGSFFPDRPYGGGKK